MKKIIVFMLIAAIAFSFSSCNSVNKKDTVKINKGSSLMIAHRGLSGIEIENTEGAFIAAGERSYYGIEADVRRTSDGKFVICHDADLKRIAGQEMNVEKMTLAELKQISLYDNNGIKKSDVHLTDLEGYITICKRYEKQAILELKSSFTDEEIASIIEIISNVDYIQKVTFISFDYDNLLKVRMILPEQSVQYLFSKHDDKTIDRLIKDRIDAAVKFTYVSSEMIDRLHSAGLKVNCWTVDNALIAENLADMGVDYITSNILE